jgi:hypothetical protein
MGAEALDDWVSGRVSNENHTLWRIAYGKGRYVAGGSGGTYVSTDGLEWTNAAFGRLGVTYGGGLFFGGGPSNGSLSRSADGLQWTEYRMWSDDLFTSGCFGNGRFVLAGSWLSPQGGQGRPRADGRVGDPDYITI